MPTKSILINYNGYPSTLDSLTPDNGLASLAGSLINNGHETLIMDFSTTGIIRRLIPKEISDELNEIYEDIVLEMRTKGQLSKPTIDKLLFLDKKLEKHKDMQLMEIADEIVEKAKHIGTDFIGFKLWTGDGFEGSVRMASRIKEKLKNIKIFAGGPHVDWFMERIFDYTDIFDVLAYGEGEETIVSLADYVNGRINLSDISNIIYKKNGEIKISELKRINNLNILSDPVYDSDVYPAMSGDEKAKFIMIDESRGCPNKCYFCIHPRKSGTKWRRRDPIRVVNLMEKIKGDLNVCVFRLSGSNTPADLKKEIANEIIRRQLKIGYSAFGHVRESEKEDYNLLKRSGCISLAFGVESGSQEILDRDINKKVKVEQIISALTECKKAGILTVASIIVPNPHDTPETLKETLDLLIKTKPDSVTMQLPGLIPNTYWYENQKEFGFELEDDYMLKTMVYKIKLLLPPILWEPLPYKINNRTNDEAVMLAQNFSLELEKNGILTGIGDFLLSIGRYLNIPIKELRDKNRRIFFTGDYYEIKNMAKLFNQEVKNMAANKG